MSRHRDADQTDDDREMEARLRAYFERELGGQLGRARRAFEAHVARGTGASGASAASLSRHRRMRALMIGTIGTALAASLAALWAVPALRPVDQPHVAGTQPNFPGVSDPEVALGPVFYESQWQPTEMSVSTFTLDRATVLTNDHRPARLIREVSVERVQWVDEKRGVRVEAFVPHDTVKLIGLDTY